MKIQDYNELIDFSDIKLTPLQAIKLNCKQCCAFSWAEAKKCEIKTCPLNQFITGKRKRKYSDEEIERRRQQMIKRKMKGEKYEAD